MVIIDTNVICRYLLKDNEKLYRLAKKIINQPDIYVDAVVLAETLWVLTKYYKLPRQLVGDKLREFINLPNIIQPQNRLMTLSLEYYLSHPPLSFIDCWLLALRDITNGKLVTFDQDLEKLVR